MAVTPSADWEPSVVNQFTRGAAACGVPQLTDAGIALYYNADLLDAAGVSRPTSGRRAGHLGPGRRHPAHAAGQTHPRRRRKNRCCNEFDGRRVRRWGYNAANDLQGINLNYIGSSGGVFADGDRFAFDNPQSVAAFRYVVDLINADHVPASDTNDNGYKSLLPEN